MFWNTRCQLEAPSSGLSDRAQLVASFAFSLQFNQRSYTSERREALEWLVLGGVIHTENLLLYNIFVTFCFGKLHKCSAIYFFHRFRVPHSQLPSSPSHDSLHSSSPPVPAINVTGLPWTLSATKTWIAVKSGPEEQLSYYRSTGVRPVDLVF